MRINKISLKDAEFGNKAENKDLLNKHIDEILYFFEKISIDIVVIEDLDRFNTTEIYRTLREVNFILNAYLFNINPSNPRKVTFLYAIKDDLFLDELDRTKFFDLIIPAIPFVNYSNSKNVLNEKLDKIFVEEKVFTKPTKEFINTVSSFITDNRSLLNIINEFIIYKEQQKLENEELNQEKLLAIIIYKNLRPKDFSRLHISKSNIDLIFLNKEKLIKKSVDALSDEIDLIEEKVKKIKEENTQSIRDLNIIYLHYIKEHITDSFAKGLIYNSERKTFEIIISNALDLARFYDEDIKYYNNTTDYPISIKITDIDANDTGYTYREKYDLIINKDKRIKEKEDEIKENQDKQNDLNNWTLKQILEDKNLSKENLKKEIDVFYTESTIEENERIYNDPLLIFLLLNGYVDEHYREYISIFQKGGINETDQEFKINIISRINDPKPYNFELTNIDDIIDGLPINYFKNDRILNIDLVNHITVCKLNYPHKFQAILDTIANWSSKRTRQFLSSYLYDGSQSKTFIIELAKSWEKFWYTIEKDPNFIETDTKQILYILLTIADNATLLFVNKNEELSSYIANDICILYDFGEQNTIERIQKILSEEVLDVKFKEILPFDYKYNKLFDILYENNRYEITYNNLSIVVKHKLDIAFNLGRFNESNLTYIYENNLEEIISYIESDNYISYIKNVYGKLEKNQNEELTNVLKVLNNEKLLIDYAEIFLMKQINKLSNIFELNSLHISDLVIRNSKVVANWKNIYDYYFEYDNTFNDNLTAFLNDENNYLDLFKEKWRIINDIEDIQKEFILKLFSNNNLTIDAYTILVKCFPQNFLFLQDFDYDLIDENKVEKLIYFKFISLNESNFKAIKAIYPELHIKLLLNDWDNYLNFVENNKIGIEDLILVLKDPKLEEKLKLFIIKNQISENFLINEKLASEVSITLLNVNDKSIDFNSILSFEKLKAIMGNKLKNEVKLKLINLTGGKLSKIQVLELTYLMQTPYNSIYPKSQIMLDDNKVNWEFIKILQSHKIAGEAKSNKKTKIRVWLNNFS